jgi:hypothetical protein
VEEYARKFAAAIPSIVKGVEKVVKFIPKVITGFEWLIDKLGGTGVAAAGLGVVFGGPAFSAIAGFIGMIKPLSTIVVDIAGKFKVLAANPAFIVIAAFAFLLKKVIDHFGGLDEWLKLMDEGLTALGEAIAPVADVISGFFTASVDGVIALFKWWLAVMEDIYAFVQPFIDRVVEGLDMIFGAVSKLAGVIVDVLGPAFSFILDQAKKALDMIKKLIEMGPGGILGEAINGPIKDEDQMKSDALAQQRSEMLRKRDAGEISNEQYNSFKAASYAPAATPAPAGGGISAATPALAGTAVSAAPGGGAQETTHTEIKEEKVQLTLNLPPGVTMSPAGGPVPDNVKVSGRASALGVANAG